MKRSATLVVSLFALVATSVAATARRSDVPQQGQPHATAAKPIMQVYKSPTCGCCAKWIEHVQAAGFDVRVTDLDETKLDAQKAKLGVAPKLQSCHTATVNGYVIEGHVPAADIQRMLKDKPAIAGLAAPGMPRGSPGMEMGGMKDKYDVVAFDKAGATKVYASH